MPLDHASPDELLPDYISPEELAEYERKLVEERENRRTFIKCVALSFLLLILHEPW